MPLRSLSPNTPDDEMLGTLPVSARWLFGMLVVKVADNEGRFRAHPAALRSAVFPYDSDIDLLMVVSWLDALTKCGIVIRYEHGGQGYGVIRRWWKHQSSQDARTFLPSLLPEPPIGSQDPDTPERFKKAKASRAIGLTKHEIDRNGAARTKTNNGPAPVRPRSGAGTVERREENQSVATPLAEARYAAPGEKPHIYPPMNFGKAAL